MRCIVFTASIVVFVENLFPSLTAVACAKNATRGVWTVWMSKGCDENNIRICGVDDDLADGATVTQANILPDLATIQRLVHSIAVRDIAADAGLSRADINHVWIRIGHGDAADR